MKLMIDNRIWKKYKSAIILFLLSVSIGYLFNVLNLYFLGVDFPEKIRLGQTIVTSDDLVYLKPVINYVDKGIWSDGSIGRQQYFSRPPGYSLFFLPYYLLFGIKKGLLFLKITQLILFSTSVICLFKLLERLLKSTKSAFVIAFLYGVFPIASGFVFYTLTEAITPAVVVFSLYFLHKGWFERGNKSAYLKATFFLAFLLLIRPVFSMLVIPLLVLVFNFQVHQESLWKRVGRVLVYLSISLMPILIWEIRVFSICKEFPGLYPVYDKEVNTIYRPSHRAIWEFGKCWGISGKEFHEHIGPIWEQMIFPDSIHGDPIGEFIKIIPLTIVKEIGEKNLRFAFEQYQTTVKIQRSFFLQKRVVPAFFSKKEQFVVRKFNFFTEQYKSKHWISYHVVVPLKYLKVMSFHSNLNLYVFQHTWRGSLVMEVVRFLSLLIHFSAFVLLVMSLFVCRLTTFTRLVSISSIIYVLFLAFYFRELEERYTIPILPILFLVSAELLKTSKIYSYVQLKIFKN